MLRVVEHLIWYDGPLLSLLKCDASNKDYITVWVDEVADELSTLESSPKIEIWALAEIAPDALNIYRSKRLTLLQIFEEASEILVMTEPFYDKSLEECKPLRYNFANFPSEWKPASNSYLPF